MVVLCSPSAQLRAAPDVRQPAWEITISAQRAIWWVGQIDQHQLSMMNPPMQIHLACSCVQFMAAMELMGAPSTAGPSFLPEFTGTGVLLQDWPAGSKPPLSQVGGPIWAPDSGQLVLLPSLQSDFKCPTTMQHARHPGPACCVHPCLQSAACCWLRVHAEVRSSPVTQDCCMPVGLNVDPAPACTSAANPGDTQGWGRGQQGELV